jgi:hypothetical protein
MTEPLASGIPINQPEHLISNPGCRRTLAWVVLIFIFALYAFCLARIHPTRFFGLSEDDSIYFSSAREIAQGRGYVLPSVPGTPAATKYPILYSWILSWVWRWNANFPDNLRLAAALNGAFGIAFLTMAFVFLRSLKGLGDVAALTITAFCAVNPTVLFLSANLMSDVLFAALTLGACILAAKTTEKDSQAGTAVLCGVVTGVSILARTLGAPVAAGLYFAILLRSGWRKSTIFAACVVPFAAATFARSILAVPQMPAVAAPPCADSWRMTWLYYTSYTGYWKADTFSNHVLGQTVKSGVSSVLFQPGIYVFNPSFIRPALLGFVLLVIVSALAVRGLVRQAQAGGWLPIHLALGCYLLPVIVWNYAASGRFLIPFLPLLLAGIWVEFRYVIAQIRASVQRPHSIAAKVAAGFFCAIGAALAIGAGISCWRGIQSNTQLSESRASLLEDKREAYSWLQQNSPADARILAYEDVSAYLYSGRLGMRPTIFSPAGIYRPEIFNRELSCLTSSAEPIGATFWLVADDDFGYEWEPANSRARQLEREMEGPVQPLFRSSRGYVRMYEPQKPGRQHGQNMCLGNVTKGSSEAK